MNATRVAARLRRMSRAELAFRLRVAARSEAGRVAAACRRPRWRGPARAGLLDPAAPLVRDAVSHIEAGNLPAAHACLARHFRTRDNRFPVAAAALPGVRERVFSEFPGAVVEASADTARFEQGRFNLLGYCDLDFSGGVSKPPEGIGLPRPPAVIDWHHDPVHGRRPPLVWWSRVPFLDPAVGDHKIIWELNRHQHFPRLARAAWLTGDPACRRTFAAHLRGWLAQNPPGMGINWSSMLELGLRSLSWLWALHLFSSHPAEEESAARDDADGWIPDLLAAMHAQLQQVLRNLSLYFSPNTHLTGEALALYVCGRALPELRDAAEWARAGRQVLLEQIGVQITPDGGHCERSTHYLRYTLDFYLMALAFARATADGAAGAFEEACERLAWATRRLSDENGRLPGIGDDDGGRLWPLREREPGDVRDSLAVAAILLDRPDLMVGRLPEEPLWLLGPVPLWLRTPSSHGDRDEETAARPTEGVAMGYHVARPRPGDHLVIDAGPHGYLNGGHAHADSLSIVYARGKRPLAIDPGTFTYTMSREWRDRLRSSAWHNTLTLDGRSQSVPDGPFHWRSAATAREQASERDEEYWFFEGVHDGYLPLVHRRRVAALGSGCLVVVDTVLGTGDHRAEVHWHPHETWRARQEAEDVIVLDHERGGSCQLATPGNTPAILVADEATGLGWRSPAYGSLLPCTTVRLVAAGRLPLVLVSVFSDWDETPLLVERVRPVNVSPGGWDDSVALRFFTGRRRDVLLFGGHPPLLPGDDTVRCEAGGVGMHRYGLGRFEAMVSARFAWLGGEAEARPRVLALVDGDAVVRAAAPAVPGLD